MTLPEMLAGLSVACAIGVKTSSKGHQQYWCGYKLHLDVAERQIPISAVLTAANVNDVNVAIPLMRMGCRNRLPIGSSFPALSRRVLPVPNPVVEDHFVLTATVVDRTLARSGACRGVFDVSVKVEQ